MDAFHQSENGMAYCSGIGDRRGAAVSDRFQHFIATLFEGLGSSKISYVQFEAVCDG